MNEKILVVEDEVLVRFDMSDHLRAEHFQVLEASTVQVAKELLNENPDVVLVFTDVQLPGPQDGLDLVHHVRANFPEVKILVTSGHLAPRKLAENFGQLIDKPYLPAEVVKQIRAALTPPNKLASAL